MYKEKISDIRNPYFYEAFAIYENSFPLEERRKRELQIELLQNKQYNFEVIIEGNKCIGIFLWWLINDYRFIEHFAIIPTLRNSGIGRKIITEFLADSEISVVLEVEKPEDALTRRRIEFYKRQGFQFVNHQYAHPPFIEHGSFLELHLMTFPHVFNIEDVTHFINTTHPIVHYKYFQKK